MSFSNLRSAQSSFGNPSYSLLVSSGNNSSFASSALASGSFSFRPQESSLLSVCNDFFAANELRPSGYLNSQLLYLKVCEHQGVISPLAVEPYVEPPPHPILFHAPDRLRAFTVSDGDLVLSCQKYPAFMQSRPSFKFFSVPSLRITDVADMVVTDLGLDTVLKSALFPVSHHVLVREGVKFWLAPIYVDFGIVELRASHRLNREFIFPEWFKARYASITQSLWTNHTDWIRFDPAGVSELLLILSGDVEQNPGPDGSEHVTGSVLRLRGGSKTVRSQKPVKVVMKAPSRAMKRGFLIGQSLLRTNAMAQAYRDVRRQAKVEAGEEKKQKSVSQEEEVSSDEEEHDMRVEDVFAPGQEYVAELEFHRTKDSGWTVSLSDNPDKWPVVSVVEPFPDGSVEFSLTNFPIKRYPTITITRAELEASQRAKIFVSPDVNLTNLTFALNRIQGRSASTEHNFLVAMVLLVLSTPHAGYVYFPDSMLTVLLYDVPLEKDPNGNEITRLLLESQGFRFSDNWDANCHKQNLMTHTAPCGFVADINMPNWSTPQNIYAMLAKRLTDLTLAPVSRQFLTELKRSAEMLADFVVERLPQMPTREYIYAKFLDGRSQSDVREGWKYYHEFEAHFSDYELDYQSSGIDFFPKLELYTEKKPPRGIACRPFKWRCFQAYTMGPVLYGIERALSDSNVKGLTSVEIRDKVRQKFEHTVAAFETDFSSFEANLRAPVRNNGENVVFKRVSDALGELLVTRSVIQDNGKPFTHVSCKSLGWHNNRFPTIRFSGDYWTSIGNQVENIIITYTLMRLLLSEHDVDLPLKDFLDGSLFEGDDGIMERNGITKGSFDDLARRSGFKLKVVEGDWTELSFCGNHMVELPDGTLVRSRDQATIAAQLSVLFTNLPRNAASSGAYLSLQRSKAISFLSSQEGWVPDTTILGWLIEGRTRSAYGDAKRLAVFRSAYGRVSEYMPFHLERCLTDSSVTSFNYLTTLVPGTDRWVDELFVRNAEAGGTFTRSDIYRMWAQLNDPERGCFADVPGLSNTTTLEINASRSYEMQTLSELDSTYARKLDSIVADRKRYLAKEAFACSENMRAALDVEREMDYWKWWRSDGHWWEEFWDIVYWCGIVLLLLGTCFVFLRSYHPVDSGVSPASAAPGKCPWEFCPAELQSPNVGQCYRDDWCMMNETPPDPMPLILWNPEPDCGSDDLGDSQSETDMISLDVPYQWWEGINIEIPLWWIDLFVFVLILLVYRRCCSHRTVVYRDPDDDDLN